METRSHRLTIWVLVTNHLLVEASPILNFPRLESPLTRLRRSSVNDMCVGVENQDMLHLFINVLLQNLKKKQPSRSVASVFTLQRAMTEPAIMISPGSRDFISRLSEEIKSAEVGYLPGCDAASLRLKSVVRLI
ncbi:hypothetical protein BJ878DRAFT_562985 [Calycina marina]|uniref:Uncharacterized protein n=1 Tax=Calycina marina TaxID=1763456 RepID=A0A9P7Z5I9_9HELO|nr:hypothetical protein BJ878DRAFT_562985 [Calycina marina]